MLVVVEDDEVDEARQIAAERQATKLFIGNLAYETKEKAVWELFEKIGQVKGVSMPPNYRRKGLNQGYCFVEMLGFDDARRARSELEGHDLDGRRLRLEWAKS